MKMSIEQARSNRTFLNADKRQMLKIKLVIEKC